MDPASIDHFSLKVKSREIVEAWMDMVKRATDACKTRLQAIHLCWWMWEYHRVTTRRMKELSRLALFAAVPDDIYQAHFGRMASCFDSDLDKLVALFSKTAHAQQIDADGSLRQIADLLLSIRNAMSAEEREVQICPRHRDPSDLPPPDLVPVEPDLCEQTKLKEKSRKILDDWNNVVFQVHQNCTTYNLAILIWWRMWEFHHSKKKMIQELSEEARHVGFTEDEYIWNFSRLPDVFDYEFDMVLLMVSGIVAERGPDSDEDLRGNSTWLSRITFH